jgi:hypothetical protein
MKRRAVVVSLCSAVLLLGQSAPSASSAISLEEVVRLTSAGVSEELVITRIKKSGKSFDLTTDEILELKRSGISDNVIRTLMDPTLPYTPPPPKQPAPSVTSSAEPIPVKKPVNPIIAGLPAEPGLYFRLAPGAPVQRLDFKPVTAAGPAAKMFGVLTAGLKKGTVSGYLVGSTAKTILSRGSHEFYLRLTEKASAEDIILVKTDAKKDRREINFGRDPAKPSFEPEIVKRFESAEIDPGVFRLECALDPGEYIFLVLGSGEEKKGIVAKGWEFGIGATSRK